MNGADIAQTPGFELQARQLADDPERQPKGDHSGEARLDRCDRHHVIVCDAVFVFQNLSECCTLRPAFVHPVIRLFVAQAGIENDNQHKNGNDKRQYHAQQPQKARPDRAYCQP